MIMIRNMDPEEALLNAAREGDAETIRQLIRDGEVDLYEFGCRRITPLHYAALNGHDHVIKELLDAGADIDAVTDWYFQNSQASKYTFKTPLQCAIESNYFATMSLTFVSFLSFVYIRDRLTRFPYELRRSSIAHCCSDRPCRCHQNTH